MSERDRPNPDDLLSAVQKSAAASSGAQLRIFLGMAAGAGKTYAMLKAAQEAISQHLDVVAGLVETHGRKETQALLDAIPVLKRRALPYRGTTFEELDIDEVLRRRPIIVLVDELAHTNIPGSRHAKRWQDVVEILDAGIEVYTTLNIQHLESRKETVEAITGMPVHETVPDTILDRASQVVLIDITPSQLLQRLREGKVYLGARAEAALQHFFKEDRLTALREVALRFTAERVDSDLHGLRISGEDQSAWRPTERLMVAISHSPFSEQIIRATRRLAFSLEAPWLAVHVDTGQLLGAEDRTTLSRNIALVRDLGGELISTSGTEIPDELERIARERQVTQLIMGRPTRRLLRDLLTRGTLLDRLARRGGAFDIHVLRPEKDSRLTPKSPRVIRSPGQAYLAGIGTVLAAALFSALVNPWIGYRAVGFVFLFATLGFSLLASLGPILLVAGLSSLTWNLFFIPPVGTYVISEPADWFMCAAYFVVSAATGTLTHLIRHREQMLRKRELHTRTLYEIVRLIATSGGHPAYLSQVAARLGQAINCDCAIATVARPGNRIERWYPDPPWEFDDAETAVAQWVVSNKSSAGWQTDTLPSARAMYLPLIGSDGVVGLIGCRPRTDSALVSDEQALLGTVARQLALALERERLEEETTRAARLQESEQLHQTLLNSISHEIRTPLTAIIGSAAELQTRLTTSDSVNLKELGAQISESADHLNHIVENLLDLTRLDTGTLTLHRDWHDPADVIGIALESLRQPLRHHRVDVVMKEPLPLVRVDLQLFEHALSNLLLNASTHTPEGTLIQVGAEVEDRSLAWWVSDQGPGIPAETVPRIFDRFYQSPNASSGTGLGLSIAKGIMEAHGGSIDVRNNPDTGCRFTLRMPVEAQPEVRDGTGPS